MLEEVIRDDYQDLVRKLFETLNELQENEDAEVLGIGDQVFNIFDGINQGKENCDLPEIIKNCKNDLEQILGAISNTCDDDTVEIEEDELLLPEAYPRRWSQKASYSC